MRCQSGFTLLELVFALAILVVGFLGLFTAIVGSMQVEASARESNVAMAAARRQLEAMKAYDFGSVHAGYSATALGGPGPSFAVDGLEAPDGEAAPGAVAFLTEEQAAAAFGLASLDLDSADADGDGANADDTVVGAGYRAYPVRITVSWQSQFGRVVTSGRPGVRRMTLIGTIHDADP